jgi:hypothetical protein
MMRLVGKIVVGLLFTVLVSCARHHVVPREQGRVDGAKGIASSSDLEWTVRGEPSGNADEAAP